MILALGLCFREAEGALAFFPLATLLEKFDAFKALEDRAFTGGATADFQAVMLGHLIEVDWMGAGS